MLEDNSPRRKAKSFYVIFFLLFLLSVGTRSPIVMTIFILAAFFQHFLDARAAGLMYLETNGAFQLLYQERFVQNADWI